MVQKHGAMIKSPNGYPMQSPYLSHANKQFEIMMKIATEFGFTPAIRARIFTYSQKNSMLLVNVDKPQWDSLMPESRNNLLQRLWTSPMIQISE